jgi:3-dehydroquinate synthase
MVEIRRGLLADVGAMVRGKWKIDRVFVLTNTTVHAHWYAALNKALADAGIRCYPMVIGDGERYKNVAVYHRIIGRLAEEHADRQSLLLTLGGGVIGDLGGFVAATYMRGIDLVHVPTTLVAQIDSSIGGKTAIDHARAKNMIGCFYHPRRVLTDPDVLATLPKREFRNGLFEAIKIGLVCNPELHAFIQLGLDKIRGGNKRRIFQMVSRCVREKVKVVDRDPCDRGFRAILNFGHTFGHALETSADYRGLGHGEAVGWGMLLALRLSEHLGYCAGAHVQESYAMIRHLLPQKKRIGENAGRLWQTMLHDKKAVDGRVNFILLKSIGKPIKITVTRRMFNKALDTL